VPSGRCSIHHAPLVAHGMRGYDRRALDDD